jgi:hypothetical protein
MGQDYLSLVLQVAKNLALFDQQYVPVLLPVHCTSLSNIKKSCSMGHTTSDVALHTVINKVQICDCVAGRSAELLHGLDNGSDSHLIMSAVLDD